jgi:NADH-ubiquinone oxidoreductase chain 5
MFFIIALILAIAVFSDLSLSTIYSLALYMNGDILFLFTVSIILAGAAKSALIPFTPWLAKAMEGPTSVSALLHSSTMVTAGVYLFIRFSPLLELSSTSLMIVLWLGSLGALFGAMCGLVDNDIKRIVAFSTMSQLGYMVVAVGISQYNIALFHLLMHAVFKSLLFLASGAILHAVLDNQNLTRMGSLNLMLPFTSLVFLFASLSLIAFPFTSGFYSKDLLLELLCVPHHFTHTVAYIFTLLAALLTTTYTIRTKMIAMISRPLFSKSMLPFVIDSSFLMTAPLLVLSLGAIVLGYFSHELFLGFGSTFYINSLFTHPNAPTFLFDATFGSSLISIIPLSFLFLIFLILIISPLSSSSSSSSIPTPLLPSKTLILPRNSHSPSFNFTTHFTLLNYFNVFYHWIMFLGLSLSNYMFRYIDKGFLEFFGPLGFLKTLHYWGFLIELISTGFIPHYAYIFISSLFLFFIFLF